MQKLIQNKEAIIASIQNRGPSLPVQIARESNLSLLFASAYLSELYGERKVKMSSMKVGSSPLYYLQGQEPMLENFVQYLNNKEKEAFNLLKSAKLLDDEKLDPAIRVAIRFIKDFAVPIRIKIDNDSKIFWKHFSISDEEVKNIAQELVGKKKEKKAKPTEEETDKQETLVKKQEIKSEKQKEENREDQIEQLKQKIDKISEELKKPELTIQKKEVKIKEKKPKIIEESTFVKNIKEYLLSKEIELLETKEFSKKDFLAKVRIDSLFGKQEYLLIAREKKKITEEDLTIALHKAQLEKMPALLMSTGDIDKKSIEHAKTWRNLVKFEKIKF